MRISDNEVKKVLEAPMTLIEAIVEIGETRQRENDEELVRKMSAKVEEMSDREEAIARLKAKIEAGQYNPTGEEIADSMIRRNIADRMR